MEKSNEAGIKMESEQVIKVHCNTCNKEVNKAGCFMANCAVAKKKNDNPTKFREQWAEQVREAGIEWQNEYMQAPLPHNDAACNAYREYDEAAERRDRAMFEQIPFRGGFMNGRRLNTPLIPYIKMEHYAEKYNTTVKEMKHHERCLEIQSQQAPAPQTLIDTLLPKDDKERIYVIASNQSSHFSHLVRILCDYAGKNLTMQYRYIASAKDLLGIRGRIIVLEGWSLAWNRHRSEKDQIWRELDYHKTRGTEIIELDDRELDQFIKK